MHLPRWRGTPDQPGLMMVLEPGGCCIGVAYRLPDSDHRGQIIRLLQRESASREGLEHARWITVETPEGKARADLLGGNLGAAPGREAGLMPAWRRSSPGLGHAGSGAEYLFHTVSKLEEHGIRDRNLWQLQLLVAKEIQRLHPTMLKG